MRLLLPLALLAPAAFSQGTDSCAALVAQANYANAKACLESFPFEQARHQQIIDNLLKALDFHVFSDITNASPDPALQPNYNLRSTVFKLKATTFPNDLAAQEAIVLAFLQMNDAHSSYDPLCYRKLGYVQHFFPTAIPDKKTGKTRIFVGGLPEPVTETDKKHLGREILEIDGKPAFNVLWEYAQTQVGRYKDASARFSDTLANMAYDTAGKWMLNAGSWASRSRLPPGPTVTYKFAAGNNLPEETVIRPWYVNLPKEKFADKQSYWDLFCKPGAAANKAQEMEGAQGKAKASGAPAGVAAAITAPAPAIVAPAAPATAPAKVAPVAPAIVAPAAPATAPATVAPAAPAAPVAPGKFLPTARKQDAEDFLHNTKTDPDRALLPSFLLAVNKAELPTPLIKSEGLAFFELPKNKSVGILSITTFSIEGDKDKWRQTLAQIIQRFNSDKKQKLIVDLTGNGGGYLDLAWETIAVLTPTKSAPFPMIARRFKRDFRLSPLHKALIKKAFETKNLKSSMNPSYFGEIHSMKAYHGLHLVEPGRKRPKAVSDPFLYSQLFQELPVDPKGNPLKDLSFNLKHQDLAVLSSGDCGSACGMLYLHLREVDGIRGAALGYVANRPRMVSTFPVTEVFTLQQLLGEVKQLGLTGDTRAPTGLPVSAVFRFPIREAYSQRKGFEERVEEYLWSGADVLIDNDPWLMLRPDRVWTRLAALLGWHKTKWVKHTATMSTDPARPFGTTPKDNLEKDASKLLAYSAAKGQVVDQGKVGTVIAGQ